MYDVKQTAGIYVDSYMLRYEYTLLNETPKPSIHTDVTRICLIY